LIFYQKDRSAKVENRNCSVRFGFTNQEFKPRVSRYSKVSTLKKQQV